VAQALAMQYAPVEKQVIHQIDGKQLGLKMGHLLYLLQ
jgi:hypothetical protein